MGKNEQGGPHLKVQPTLRRNHHQTWSGHQFDCEPKCGLLVLWVVGCWNTAGFIQCHSRYRIIVSTHNRWTMLAKYVANTLDRDRSDLWIADNDCISGCSTVPTFDPAQSSTFTNLTTPFQIKYGSGQASGVLGQDIVQMAGFSVANQFFGELIKVISCHPSPYLRILSSLSRSAGVCDVVSRGLLIDPVSGLLGLGFQAIASSRATPFWQTLVENGAWDSPVMGFHLTRFVDQRNINQLEPGGSFTMGE